MDEVQQLEVKKQELERENRRLEAAEEQLSNQLMRQSGGKARLVDRSSDSPNMDSISERCLLGRPASLSEVLAFISATFPNRILVLPNALRSAKEASGFLYPERALEKLIILGGKYWSALTEGEGGDVQASAFFGSATFASKESNILSAKGRRLRTFQYDDKAIFMGSHLRIGVKESPNACWRCHFHWDAQHCVIVVGHCGKHLDP